MITLSVADILFALTTRRESALRKLMAENYGGFLAEPAPADRTPLFTINLDHNFGEGCKGGAAGNDFGDGGNGGEHASGTGGGACQNPLQTFEYPIGPDRATLKIFPDNTLRLSILNAETGLFFELECHGSGCDGCDGAPDNGSGWDGASGGSQKTLRFDSNLAALEVAPPRHILDHLLIFAFSVAGLRSRTLLIHASTIVYEGRAVMFLGESGTGKSTHTRMWLENIDGAHLLNDDAPALRIFDDGTVKAYGTPWSGKTPCYRPESAPLAALTRIKRAPHNRMTRCESMLAFGAVLPSCLPTLQQCDATLDRLCDALSALLESVPVFTLECLPDPDAAHTARSAIFG